MPSNRWNNLVGSGSGAVFDQVYDNITTSAGKGYLVNPRVILTMKSGWSDTSNIIEVAGDAVVDKRIHPDGANSVQPLSGSRTWYVGAEGVPLSYGAPTEAYFDLRVVNLAFFNGEGSDLTRRWTISFPALPYELPNPPQNPTATKTGGTSATLSWTANFTSASGPRPWVGVRVYRRDNINKTWAQIAQVSWDVTSYADTSLALDRHYEYYLASYNSRGESAAANTAAVITTPLAPSNGVASKSGSNIVLTWKNNSTMNVGTRIELSTNNGASWTYLATAPQGAATWTHTGYSPSVSHQYRLASEYSGVLSGTTVTNNLLVISAPAMPTYVSPSSGYVPTGPITAKWAHQSLDGTTQSAYEFQYRINGGAWVNTGKVTSSATQATIPSQSLNTVVEWQVRTWGQHANPSPWSSPAASVTVTTLPSVSIVSPANGSTVGSAQVTAQIAYSGAAALASTDISVYQGSATRLMATFTGSATSFVLSYVFQNLQTYTVNVRVTDARGQYATASATFSVEYAGPLAPTVVAEPNNDDGTILVSVINPVPGGGSPAAIKNLLYRSTVGGGAATDWKLLTDNLPPNGAYTDRTPPMGGNVFYLAIAMSSVETYTASAITQVSFDQGRCAEYIWISGGPDFSLIGRFRGNPAIDVLHERDKILRKFAGRTHPVQFVGVAIQHEIKVTGVLEQNDPLSTEDRFTKLQDWDGVVLYRDMTGRRVYGSLGAVSFVNMPYNLRQFSAKITQVDYDAD